MTTETTTKTVEEPKIRVRLDNRTVMISDSDWPEIGGARGSHECGQYAQNGRTWWRVRIRRHADGRVLVYLVSGGGCQCGLPSPAAAGALLTAGRVDAIESTARRLIALGHTAGDDGGDVAGDLRQCMQSLPAEEV